MILCIAGSFATNKKYFYYGPDGQVFLDFSTEKILVRFDDNLTFAQKADLLRKEIELQPITEQSLLPSPRVAVVLVKAGVTQEKIEALLTRLGQTAGIVYATPFLVYSDGTLQGIQDKFLVLLKDASQYNLLVQTASRNGVKIDGEDEYVRNLYHLSVTKLSGGSALDMANKFFETRLFQYSEPDFLRVLKVNTPNDPFLTNQWEINNTGLNTSQYGGTAGCDLNVFNAWTITTGSSSIKVAVIDEGVQLTHPDLSANLLAGFDATGLGSNGGPASSDAHGTNCSGIIAAVGNNSLGVAGIAYGCKIIPIRLGYESPPGTGQLFTSDTWISNCFNYAWNTAGADVISNSWGGGSVSSTITNAINTATTSGRGGNGTAVLFAAGNSNSSVQYPATLTSVISVAAMSMCNTRKTTSSCDGENFWGSNFGTGLDVGAPGVKIYSTDLTGSAGYSNTDYFSAFNGTSSACPAVAAVMALIYSVNPSLTLAQARFDLESTCQKVGGYSYAANVSGQPNGTWTSNLGYGRVDAYAAMLAASGVTCITPTSLTATSITSSGATLSWGSAGGATGYNVQYRPTGNPTWTSTTSATTSLPVSGLTASTQYEFHVQSSCSGGDTSAFSASANFTTLSNNPCTETFEPNNNKNTAATISVGVDISSQVSSNGDVDWYKFNNTSGASNIKVTLTNLPANYNEALYNSSNTQVAISKKTGTLDESMIFNTGSVGTYKIKVNGASGAFSSTQCYTLHVFTSSTPFRLGDGLSVASSENTLKVYPNPNAGVMTLEYNSNTNAIIQVRIFDVTGRILVDEQQQISEGTNMLHPDLNKLMNGVYFVEISNGNQVSRSKFMIEK